MMSRLFAALTCLSISVSFGLSTASAQPAPKLVTSVEGISEYELANGMRVLLFPDPTKDTVTVNNTIFVGSRHEGYGEKGMAHLLEHMVFKGTPTFPDIPKVLAEHGAGRSMNGTTWLDRTNYFETMPSTDENLEFAIKLEADRMMNSYIKAEDLASEMTVVRSEFERGENSPSMILDQRIVSAAFDWHNYGMSTIGNRADIERVPVKNLREFYQRFYQPDNAMLVISGGFHEQRALEYVNKYFGTIPRPERELNATYTEEPTQDGERTVTLRRVGDVAMVGVAYHIVAGPHPDFTTTDVLATSLVNGLSGRLYDALVETKLAASVRGGVYPTHDPNLLTYMAEVVQGVEPQQVADAMLEVLEGIPANPITAAEVERARAALLSQWEKSSRNSARVAINLSEWASQGDWRLFFLYRDRLETAQLEDVNRIAAEVLIPSNRTLGFFIPTKDPQRARIPATPDLAEMIGDYQGRGEVAMGEKFDVSPENIESRSQRSSLPSGLRVVILPKKTRGALMDLRLTLRFGDLESLQGKAGAIRLLGGMLMRGTTSKSRQEIQDERDKYGAELNISSSAGSLTCTLKTKRETLIPVLNLLGDILNNPSFPSSELETLKQSYISQFEQFLSDPIQLAHLEVIRRMRPYSPDDPRYAATYSEIIEQIRDVTIEDIRSLYTQMIGDSHGDLTIIGDFDPEQVLRQTASMLESLPGSGPFERLEHPPIQVERGFEEIETPDKANAAYFAATVIPIRDDHEDYPALMIGNAIFGGGGALSSRLAMRIRQQEGLSYGVRSALTASAHDDRTELLIYAICNPANSPKVRALIDEELNKLLTEGITEAELKKAITDYIQSQRTMRAQDDRVLAKLLEKNTFAGRTMQYVANLENQVQNLSVDQVNAAIRKYIDLGQIFVVSAGDFSGQASSSAN